MPRVVHPDVLVLPGLWRPRRHSLSSPSQEQVTWLSAFCTIAAGRIAGLPQTTRPPPPVEYLALVVVHRWLRHLRRRLHRWSDSE